MLASLIGFAVMSANTKTNYAAEAYLLQIVHGTYLVGTVSINEYSRKCWKENREQPLIRNLSVVALAGFPTWFWWEGFDHFKPTTCGTYGYYFYKLDLYDRFQIFIKVCSILVLVQGINVVSNFIFTLSKLDARMLSTDSYQLNLRNSLRDESAKKIYTQALGRFERVR
jgi:hypothetical protein